MSSFLEHFLFQVRSRPEAPALMTMKATVSYEELAGRARNVARYLADNGVKKNDILVVNLNDPQQHCAVLIAAMSAGIATISSPGPRPSLPKNLAVQAILTEANLPGSQARVLKIGPTWIKDLPYENSFPEQRAKGPDDVARIICTSGTTGDQKAVPFTEDQLIQRVWAQVAGLRPLAGPSKTVGMMGLSSGAGFTNMMLVWMTGGTLMLVPGMQQLARVASLYQLDRIIASTAQLIAMLRQQENESADFTGVKSMVVGGSHIPRSVAKRARAICRNIICLYGSTEVGVVATAAAETMIKNQSAVGYVAPGVRVEIVNESGKALGFDSEGIIRVKVPGAPNRYLNDPAASREVFRDGWFYPGDIGTLSPEGMLFVSGRVSERINAGGVKVAPNIIEDIIGQRPEISDCAAFELVNDEGISEIAVAIVPHENIDRANFNRSELRQSVHKQLRERTPKRWVIVKEIPRTEQGKIDRKALQQLARGRVVTPAAA